MNSTLSKLGVAKATALTTALTLVAAHALSWPMMFIANVDDYTVGAIMATISPIVIGSPVFYVLFRLLVKLEARERELSLANEKLMQALNQVKELGGLLPICSFCKKIRDDSGYWNGLEIYLAKHSKAEFTHSICPECSERMRGQLDEENESFEGRFVG